MKHLVNRKTLAVFGTAGLALVLAASLTLTLAVTEADGLRQENTRPDWPMPNFNEHNTRNAPESTIDSSNVNTLGEVWAFEIPGMGNAYGGAASNPLIADGTVYFQDLGSNVFAIDLETGEVQWEHMFDTPVTGPNGPGLNQERVFVGIGQDTVVALDRATGEEVWRTVVDGPTGYSQLAALDNTVYLGTGTRAYTPGVSGFIYALNADDGSVKWQFQTVEEGFWGAPEINSGAGVWYPPALDLERGVGYWGTGNPAPFAGIVGWPNGSSRPGPNLYANSTLALDLEAGELQWYDQPNPHDVFDLDFQSPRILTTATVNGSERTIVVASGKLGRVIANDVETGEQLWDTEVGEHQNDDAAGVNPGETLTVMPGTLGGVETPMALADNVVYVPVVNLASTHSPTGFDAVDGPQALENVQTNIPEGRGEFVAIDVTSGAILWTTEYDTPIFSGATVINDLVFFATFDGMIHALNRESGEEMWSYQAPAQINAWPAVSGDTIVWPAGLGETPVLLALRLGAAEGTMMEGDGEETDMEAGLDGAALVEERCTVCHSRERIDNEDKTAEEWAATVDRMISNGAMLNDAERDAVIQYLAETH